LVPTITTTAIIHKLFALVTSSPFFKVCSSCCRLFRICSISDKWIWNIVPLWSLVLFSGHGLHDWWSFETVEFLWSQHVSL